MKEERLYIVGYMASGKTTFGRALAARTGWQFIDLDEETARREGMDAASIIRERGEASFRAAERETLKSTASMKRVIVACGGGTPCHRDNMEFMTLHGITLWLVASPDKITERLLQEPGTRPLIDEVSAAELPAFVASHLRKRQPHYCKAQLRLDAGQLETEEMIRQTVDRFLADEAATAIFRSQGEGTNC